MIHLDERQLKIKIDNTPYLLLAVHPISPQTFVAFLRKPNSIIYQILTIPCDHPQFVEFTFFIAYVEHAIFDLLPPIFLS